MNADSRQERLDVQLGGAIRRLFTDAIRISLGRPSTALFFLRMLLHQTRARRLRRAWLKRGLQVPSFMIVSVTRSCNLRCKGCYAQAQHRRPGAEMTTDELSNLLRQARELGVSIILLAGGEPFTRPEILDVARDFPDLMFVVFTNGLLLDERIISRLAGQKNVVPVISLEGYSDETDTRRGEGVYQRVTGAIGELERQGVFYGASLTVTRGNFDTVIDPKYVGSLLRRGCRAFFYIEFVPVDPQTQDLTLTSTQRVTLSKAMTKLRAESPGLFLAFPGDEEAFGGCLASGRGFVHISPEGNIEPCPFAPFSDSSIRSLSLKDALRSAFLTALRDNHHLLTETSGGCALWARREWVQSLLSGSGPAPDGEPECESNLPPVSLI